MKKNFLLLTTLSILFAACTKEMTEPSSNGIADGKVMYFTANSENAVINVKATINTGSGVVAWENGDEILVSNGKAQAVFTYNSETQQFRNEAGLEATGSYTAWYPAAKITAVSGTTATLNMPATQTYSESTVREAPMVATSSSNALNFKNLCAILKVQVEGEHTISSVVFTAAEKGVSGSATISGNSLSMASTDGKTVTLTAENVELTANSAFYLLVPAQVYTGGFSLDINCTDGWKFNKSTGNAVGLTAGHIDAMKAFEAKLFSGGTGTAENPFRISSEADLIALSNYTNGDDYEYFIDKSYIQTVGITMTAENFTPICNSTDRAFKGHFDGNAKTINDLIITSDANNVGMFGCMEDGLIEDIHLSGSATYTTITGAANVGAVVGRMTGGVIKDCGFGKTKVIGTGNCCGIIAGLARGAKIEQNSIGASCSVNSSGMQVGGIVGKAETGTTVEYCEVKSCTLTGSQRVGGVAGYVGGNSVINACTSGAKIVSTNTSGVVQCGGVVGYMHQTTTSTDNTVVINCIYGPDLSNKGATITVKSGYTNYLYLGGLVGAAANCANGTSQLKIVNCYSNPSLIKNTNEAGFKGVGGVLGGTNCANTSVLNCYTPMMHSNFYLNGTTVSNSNYGNYPYIGSIVGFAAPGMTIDGAYGKAGVRLFNTENENTRRNLTTALSDPSIKNQHGLVHHSGYDFDVASYDTFKEALDAGAAAYNASNPTVKALNWVCDTRFDGHLKPEGVFSKSTYLYKKVSLIGDSISTYRGYIFEDQSARYNPYYPKSWTSDNVTTWGDILTAERTWWWKLIYNKMENARLEICNAYSGSSCCYIDDKTPNYDSHNVSDAASTNYSFRNRYRREGIGDPDIVIIYGGRNDFGKYGGSTDDYLGTYTTEAIETQYEEALDKSYVYRNFTNALTGLVTEINIDHPGIKFLILCHDMISDGYEAACKNIATVLARKGIDIKCVSFHETGTKNQTNTTIGITKDAASSCHPNNAGTTAMANYIYEQVGTWLDE